MLSGLSRLSVPDFITAFSPASETGMKTKTTPHGNLEGMLNPLALALAAGCGYIARGFSGDVKLLVKLYQEGIQFPGFALIDVFSPCVTFNHAAMDRPMEWVEKIPIGLFYRNPNPRPPLDAQDPGLQSGPLVSQPLGVTKEQRAKLIAEFM